MKKSRSLLPLLGVLLLLSLLVGCQNSPTDSPTENTTVSGDVLRAPDDAAVQFAARVEVTDANRRMLLFAGHPDTVIALENCQIVRLNGNEEAPIPFTDIKKGDTVQVTGNKYQYAYVYAYKLGVCNDTGLCRLAARVQTVNQEQRRLMLEGCPDTVVALQNCLITRLNGSDNAPVPFTEIHPGDSVAVIGDRTQNQTVLAQRLQICTPGQGTYDVAIRDEITAIDYAAGTFTVATRTETVTIDENTVIWTNLTKIQNGSLTRGGDDNTQALGEGNFFRVDNQIILAFADLKVGDVIELRANIVDENTLLAGIIKVVPECVSTCLNFTDYLASVDVETRTVTFLTETRPGTACPGAQLIGLDGEELTLADFAAGDYVTVKAYPLEDGTLKISQMTKTVVP